jgi:NCAIR mutase (PurE)-related protein
MKKVFSLDILVKSENKTRIVQDIFNVSIDNSSMVLFQRFDKDWEEFIDCAIDDIKHKDKINVVIIRKQENHDYGNLQVISILTW